MKIKLKGACMVANVLNSNGRLYPTEALESAHQTIQTYKSYGSYLLGEPFTCEHLDVNIKNVSHKILDSYIEDDILYIETELLDTNSGRNIQSLISSGCNIYFSPRGSGNVTNDNVVDDYELSSIDIHTESSFNVMPCEIIKEHIEMDNNIEYNESMKKIIDNLVEN